MEGHDGQIGSVMFAGGISDGLFSYNEIMHVTACTGPVEDVATGIMLCPQYDGREFVVDAQTRDWNRLRPADETHAAVMRAACDARLGIVQPPEPTVDSVAEMRAFLERVVIAIGALEKGSPRDWSQKRRPPDATQLSEALGATVSASVRDAAWVIAQEGAETPESVLSRVLKKCARLLRQLCESRQWPTERSGEGLMKIIAERVTLDEAKALEA